MVEKILSVLSPAQKAAQQIIIAFGGESLSPAQRQLVSLYPWGGVILFKRNLAGREQVKALVADLQGIASEVLERHCGTSLPFLITVDQEGGGVSPLEGLVTSLPGNMALAATGKPEFAYLAGKITGEEIRELGFNLDFAPVVDLNMNPINPVIGPRSFGDDPQNVAVFSREFIQGLHESEVLATAKHFPGHGRTREDSHLQLPTVDASLDTLLESDLVPFQEAIASSVDCIMTAHVLYPSLDPDRQATLSPAILRGLLREKMGFQGLVVTDSFSMKAITNHVTVEEGAVKAVQAGADLLLSCGEMEDHLLMVQGIVKGIEQGKISLEATDRSVRRIIQKKMEIRERESRRDRDRGGEGGGNERAVEGQERCLTVKEIHDSSITLVQKGRRFPLALEPAETLLLLLPEQYQESGALPMGRLVKGAQDLHLSVREMLLHDENGPTSRQIAEAAEGAGAIIFATGGRDPRFPYEEVVHSLSQMEKPVCICAFGSPYHLRKIPATVTAMAAYHSGFDSVHSLFQVLFGKMTPRGKLPVSLPSVNRVV